ncbi:hypothetical protein [Natronorubrum halophilum]|uniref:hypothetical protein n=1 Tax=Natronorubrum halophilum TaxID=1702106 RepID=UPI0010C1A6BF|nr:hypothetical protein [Natronorubrum halophilum]
MGQDRRRDRNPGRQTRPATSATRRTWYGLGKLSSAEKSGFGRILHDCSYVFGDISILALPTLFAIMAAPGRGIADATAAGLLAWTTMVAVATLIRGGWIEPVGTDTLGWVAITPSLVVLRFVYYNLALSVAVFGGVWLAGVVGVAPLSLGTALVVSSVSILAFPRLAESAYGSLRGR